MPSLGLSELNIVVATLGAFSILHGIISAKIKQAWYLGEALPAMLIGIALGPVAANFLRPAEWASKTPDQISDITLGVTRVVICLQLVIAGYQLPAKYPWDRRFEVFMCLIPIMTLMWLFTTACFLATIPKITLLASLAIAASCTCTDPVLSQAVAKGPFADKYVARPLREIISAEASLNDGFGSPFLMIAVYLFRHATPIPGEGRSEGRIGGGPSQALKDWIVETWLYYVLLSVLYGALVGYTACHAFKFVLKRQWIDSESYVLLPSSLGLFLMGSCGLIGTNDLLASAVAGCALNWDGDVMQETQRRNDEVNTCIDALLNFGGFMYIGTIIPWSTFHDPHGTGITIWHLFLLGIMVLALRRIPAIFMSYRLMPRVVANWKEALFMGYFGPIGIGAVFYVEHTRLLFPEPGEADPEVGNMIRALPPTIYFLVVFSIVIHGLSIPLLNFAFDRLGIEPVHDDAVAIRRKSMTVPEPPNAVAVDQDGMFVAYNRFPRPTAATIQDHLPLSSFDLVRVESSTKFSASAVHDGKSPAYPKRARKRRYKSPSGRD